MQGEKLAYCFWFQVSMATPFLGLGLEGSKVNRLEAICGLLAFSSFSLLAPLCSYS